MAAIGGTAGRIASTYLWERTLCRTGYEENCACERTWSALSRVSSQRRQGKAIDSPRSRQLARPKGDGNAYSGRRQNPSFETGSALNDQSARTWTSCGTCVCGMNMKHVGLLPERLRLQTRLETCRRQLRDFVSCRRGHGLRQHSSLRKIEDKP